MRFKVAWIIGSWKKGTSGSVLGASTPICNPPDDKYLQVTEYCQMKYSKNMYLIKNTLTLKKVEQKKFEPCE